MGADLFKRGKCQIGMGKGVTVLLILLLIALFHHSALGLQVIVEDYIRSKLKFAAIVGVRPGSLAVAVAGILATLDIAIDDCHIRTCFSGGAK